MKRIDVVQHTSAEYLGLIEDHLEGRGVRFTYHRPFATQGALPRADAVAAGLVLLGGGPWGSAGERDVPTLSAEVDLTRACLARSIPVIGFGLGAQVLALAAGGGSQAAPLAFRVGEAWRTRDDALAGFLPPHFPVATYQRDRAVPPAQALVLATDEEGEPAVWQLGRAAIGFAGHPGLKVAMVEDLVMEFDESAPDLERGLAALRAGQRDLEDALVPIMTGLVRLTGWMDDDAAGARA
jgi:GMP synthase-like glutamine amidotransferase